MNSAVNLRSANSDKLNILFSDRPPIAQQSQPNKPVQIEASEDIYEAIDNVDDAFEEPTTIVHSIQHLNTRIGFLETLGLASRKWKFMTGALVLVAVIILTVAITIIITTLRKSQISIPARVCTCKESSTKPSLATRTSEASTTTVTTTTTATTNPVKIEMAEAENTTRYIEQHVNQSDGTVGQYFVKMGPYGAARGGLTWTELSYFRHGNITGFNVTFGNMWLKNLNMRYGNTWATRPENMVDFNRREQVLLAQDEHIKEITIDIAEVAFGEQFIVSSIALRTTLDKSHGPYGPATSTKREQVRVSGKVLRYIAGSSGDVLDSLTFYFA